MVQKGVGNALGYAGWFPGPGVLHVCLLRPSACDHETSCNLGVGPAWKFQTTLRPTSTLIRNLLAVMVPRSGRLQKQNCAVQRKRGLVHTYDPELDPAPVTGFESEDVFGGGTLRFAFSGGNLANLSMRSSFIALALISVNPGLWSPTTLDEKEDRSRVA